MTEKTFRNGVKLTVPDGVSVVCAVANKDDYETETADGVMTGDKPIIGGLILGAFCKFFNDLNTKERKLFCEAVVEIIQDIATDGLNVITIRRKNPEGDSDE